MKKLFLLFAGLVIFFNGFAQSSPGEQEETEGYSDWLFVQSDKALQYRFKLEKQEGDIGYYQVQFRINFEDDIFCDHPTCLGYLAVFGYPDLDNQTSVQTSYKFYNTFKGVYTRPDLVPIRLAFPDGSTRFLKQEGFYYTEAGSTEEQPNLYLFSNCVDNMLEGQPDTHRCKPYQPEFKSAEAIELK